MTDKYRVAVLQDIGGTPTRVGVVKATATTESITFKGNQFPVDMRHPSLRIGDTYWVFYHMIYGQNLSLTHEEHITLLEERPKFLKALIADSVILQCIKSEVRVVGSLEAYLPFIMIALFSVGAGYFMGIVDPLGLGPELLGGSP